MKRWTAWQNWVAVAAGLYTVLAMTWTTEVGQSAAYMLTGGIALIVLGVINLAAPGMPAAEWVQLVVAALVVASPWMGSFASGTPMVAWHTWIPGIVALVASAMAIKPTMRLYHEHHPVGSH
ncbi:SPW repeat protein [Paeniglutamicibacter sulfureus]|uniref:SPW repeat domain-containing protein n=1 Tax=Paeniglutamicibacter sulfureus TaxID=43666 RepID=UPI002664EC73|nr:SPW repeat protein [Paeniglutamicibacter sulfureus]MDO2935910.1 SPW repeat protein [Paeniglutamicibacter sulfureus]